MKMDPMLLEAENAGHVGNDLRLRLNTPAAEVTSMERKLFEAVSTGNMLALESIISENIHILQQLTPMKDTSIHIAAGQGHLDMVKSIHSRCPSLLSAVNSEGDTPLHIAARAGQLHIVAFLLESVKSDVEIGRAEVVEILRKGNREDDTLMHEAVRYGHTELVKRLLGEDPELLCIDNHAGASPLYVAVEKGELEIVQQILEKDRYSCTGPNSRTALHTAIIHKNLDIAEVLLRKKPELVRMLDYNKRTALHFASALGFLPSVHLLLEHGAASTNYFLDKNGSAPVHMAACFGRVDIIEEFLRRCPDLKDMVDGNSRNILHIAVEFRQVNVVRYILKEKKLEKLVKARDKEGNTPLHQATINCYPYMVNLLVRTKAVDGTALNRKRLTALDVARAQSRESTEDAKELVLATLLYFTSSPWSSRSESVRMQMLLCGVNQRLMSIDWYKDKVDPLLVVATLVATVAFAAGFTMPGGYQSDGARVGMPTLVRVEKFAEFIWWDTMAMYFSMVAVIALIWIQFVRHLLPTFLLLHMAQVLTILALMCMSLAFISGLNLTLIENESLSRNISRLGYTFYAIGLATVVQYLSPVLYISQRYIYFRSWINELSAGIFRSSNASRQGDLQKDISVFLLQ